MHGDNPGTFEKEIKHPCIQLAYMPKLKQIIPNGLG
jgi:hypothetical protein